MNIITIIRLWMKTILNDTDFDEFLPSIQVWDQGT